MSHQRVLKQLSACRDHRERSALDDQSRRLAEGGFVELVEAGVGVGEHSEGQVGNGGVERSVRQGWGVDVAEDEIDFSPHTCRAKVSF